MSVVVETTLGDITVDLFIKERPRACLNFLKLCKIKYYNYNLFHTVTRRFIAQTGDPTGSRNGGESIFGVLDGPLKRFFVAETKPRIKHTVRGLISFVGNEDNMIGSQFFFTLADDLTYLDEKHCVFGEVAEGLDVLEVINEAICDSDDRPYQDIRITHTVILDDPLPDLEKMVIPSRSPSPSAERLQGGRIAADEEIDEIAGKSTEEINEMIAEREAKARATILEMVGDLPDADMAPPENVLFVCKLNPVTSDDDLEIIFSRFGKIKSCEVIRDHKTGDSLQYAFIEFEDKKSCEEAYFKMDNVLIDDRRIHVDFSQSVSKVKWMGKGRGVKHFTENGSKKKHDSKKTSYHEYNQSGKYSKSERKRSSKPKYDNGGRYRQKNRSPTTGHRRIQKSRSRSLTPEYSKRRSRRSRSRSSNGRSSSPKHSKTEKGRSLLPDKRYKKNTKRERSRTPENNTTEKRTSTLSSDHKKGYNEVKIKSRSRKSRSPSYRKTKRRKSRSSSTDSSASSSTSESSSSESTDHSKNRKNRKVRSRSRTSRSSSPEIKKNYKKDKKKERSNRCESPSDEKNNRVRSKSGSSKSMSVSKSHKRTSELSKSRSRSRSHTPRSKKTKNRRSRSRNSRSLSPHYKKRRESSRSIERSTSNKYKKYRK